LESKWMLSSSFNNCAKVTKTVWCNIAKLLSTFVLLIFGTLFNE